MVVTRFMLSHLLVEVFDFRVDLLAVPLAPIIISIIATAASNVIRP